MRPARDGWAEETGLKLPFLILLSDELGIFTYQNYLGVQVSTIREKRLLVNGEASARISAQVSVMCSSDARAVGILAASVAVIGVAVTAAFVVKGNLHVAALCVGFAVSAAMSAFMATWALWPTNIDLPGWSPAEFEEDWEKAEEEILLEMLPFLQQRIDDNRVLVEKLSQRSTAAIALLASSPISGLGASLLPFGGFVAGLGLVLILPALAFAVWIQIPAGLKRPT